MIKRLAVLLLAATVAACATVQKLDAASDVHALLIAIRDNDGPTFDRLVDRRAIMRGVSDRLAAEAAKDSRIPAGLAAVLAQGLTRLAGDSLIQPGVFRTVAEYYGYTPQTKIPGKLAISQTLREMPDGRVCATRQKDGPCLLIFAKAEDGRWRLSGFDGDLSMLRLPR
jgi:hypothetical protein